MLRIAESLPGHTLRMRPNGPFPGHVFRCECGEWEQAHTDDASGAAAYGLHLREVRTHRRST